MTYQGQKIFDSIRARGGIMLSDTNPCGVFAKTGTRCDLIDRVAERKGDEPAQVSYYLVYPDGVRVQRYSYDFRNELPYARNY